MTGRVTSEGPGGVAGVSARVLLFGRPARESCLCAPPVLPCAGIQRHAVSHHANVVEHAPSASRRQYRDTGPRSFRPAKEVVARVVRGAESHRRWTSLTVRST